MISVGVITAPRPQETLTASLLSLRRAGYNGHINITADMKCDATPPKGVADLTITWNNPPKGNFRNWLFCASILLKDDPITDWCMICEDDITWAEGAFPILEQEIEQGKVPRYGMASLFLPRRMAKLHTKAGLPPRGYISDGMQVGKKMWGAQCLLVRKGYLRELVNSPAMASFVSNHRYTKNVDAIIAMVIEQLGDRIFWRSPGLVHHELGQTNSSLGYPERPNLITDAFEDPACPL